MKALISFILFATVAASVVSTAQAAGSNEPLLLAQVQKDQKQPKVAGQAKNSVLNETKVAGCDRDRIAVPAGETWCKRGTLYQCSTASNTWVGTGKKCP